MGRALGTVLAMLALAGCGYVGEPLPPSLGIPERITDLSVVQRGGQLVARFTAPAATTDGVLLRHLERLELRVGPAEGWAEAARSLDAPAAAPGAATVTLAAREWVGQEVALAVRAWGRKGRPAEWSNRVAFRVTAPLERPAGLKAEAVAAGVRLTWEGARGAAFRILRDKAELALAEAPPYVDATAVYGKTYQYAVQAVRKTGDSVAEGEVSETVSITPEDRFPPAVPAGLTAVAGLDGVALSWEPNAEPDLRGYYLYRSFEGGPFQRLGDLLEAPAASDRGLQSGRRYRYAVSAADQRGNESARSAAVEVTAP